MTSLELFLYERIDWLSSLIIYMRILFKHKVLKSKDFTELNRGLDIQRSRAEDLEENFYSACMINDECTDCFFLARDQTGLGF